MVAARDGSYSTGARRNGHIDHTGSDEINIPPFFVPSRSNPRIQFRVECIVAQFTEYHQSNYALTADTCLPDNTPLQGKTK